MSEGMSDERDAWAPWLLPVTLVLMSILAFVGASASLGDWFLPDTVFSATYVAAMLVAVLLGGCVGVAVDDHIRRWESGSDGSAKHRAAVSVGSAAIVAVILASLGTALVLSTRPESNLSLGTQSSFPEPSVESPKPRRHVQELAPRQCAVRGGFTAHCAKRLDGIAD